MRDTEVVAAIVAGDPEGLAAAYDKYAAPLYSYCRSILREPADAADAVQDTFVIAASRLGGLRDQERLRPWLYAVARNECRRRLRARANLSALDEASEVTDATADAASGVERAELRALLRAAAGGLNPAEQEVIELQLRQGLDPAEVADVLGISRNHAHALISRARDQLETCLGVLLVARTGRHDCPALNILLEGWDGGLNVLLRKRLHRHVERCPACTERKRNALRPALLLGLAPLAAMPVAAMAPPGLRDQVLHLAASNHPDAVAHRAALAGHSGAYGQAGFPKPIDPPKVHLWQGRPIQVAAAAATAAAVIIATTTLSGGPAHNSASGARGPAAAGPGASSAPSAPGPTPVALTSGTHPPGASGTPLSSLVALPGSGLPTTQVATPVARSTSPVTTPGSTPGRTPSGSGSPSPSPSRTGPGSSSPGQPSPTTQPPGTVAVSPATVVLSLLAPSALTITAHGGPVSWSVTEPSSLIGRVNFSPASGTLQAGQSATVSVTVSGLISLDSTLTVNPGGHAVTIILGLL